MKNPMRECGPELCRQCARLRTGRGRHRGQIGCSANNQQVDATKAPEADVLLDGNVRVRRARAEVVDLGNGRTITWIRADAAIVHQCMRRVVTKRQTLADHEQSRRDELQREKHRERMRRSRERRLGPVIGRCPFCTHPIHARPDKRKEVTCGRQLCRAAWARLAREASSRATRDGPPPPPVEVLPGHGRPIGYRLAPGSSSNRGKK